ncbi:MAG: SH3 domain-containing protein [Pedobacter sp.]|nr:SH3 domain-containing protein [Pedobacter sp.]
MRLLLLTAGLLASALAITTAWAEPASLLKDSEMRAKPLGDADIVVMLKAKEKVEITARKGAWANIQTTKGQTGWVRLLNLRTGSGQKGDVGAGAIASLFKTGSSGNTVSTGVKGLSEEKLKNAQPNEEEAQRLDKYKNNGTDARSYAKQGKLTANQVNYLPVTGANGGNE